MPATNARFWKNKFKANEQRDIRVRAELESLGWSAEVIWECETMKPQELERRLIGILGRQPRTKRLATH